MLARPYCVCVPVLLHRLLLAAAAAALQMLLACFCAARSLFCLLLATTKAMTVVCESAACVCRVCGVCVAGFCHSHVWPALV